MSLKTDYDVSVILPTFHEALNVSDMISQFRQVIGKENEILVVGDNSHDGTSEIVKEMMRDDVNLKIVLRQSDPGLAVSTEEGIIKSSGRIVVWLDCDLSHPPEKITDLLDEKELTLISL
jgi:dolichol-phosphate mannosyltransferase